MAPLSLGLSTCNFKGENAGQAIGVLEEYIGYTRNGYFRPLALNQKGYQVGLATAAKWLLRLPGTQRWWFTKLKKDCIAIISFCKAWNKWKVAKKKAEKATLKVTAESL